VTVRQSPRAWSGQDLAVGNDRVLALLHRRAHAMACETWTIESGAVRVNLRERAASSNPEVTHRGEEGRSPGRCSIRQPQFG
jgi:hypothetical protein